MRLLRIPALPRLHTFDTWMGYRNYRFLWIGNFCGNNAQWLQLLTVGWLVRDLSAGSSSSSLLVDHRGRHQHPARPGGRTVGRRIG